jgi:hypothetical protein
MFCISTLSISVIEELSIVRIRSHQGKDVNTGIALNSLREESAASSRTKVVTLDCSTGFALVVQNKK